MTTKGKPKGPVLQGKLGAAHISWEGDTCARSGWGGGHRWTAEALCGHGVHPPDTTALISDSEGEFAEGDPVR